MLHSSDPSQWLIKMTNLFEFYTITSRAAECGGLQEQPGTWVAKASMAKAAIAGSYRKK